jgi:hypothetical protein
MPMAPKLNPPIVSRPLWIDICGWGKLEPMKMRNGGIAVITGGASTPTSPTMDGLMLDEGVRNEWDRLGRDRDGNAEFDLMEPLVPFGVAGLKAKKAYDALVLRLRPGPL